MKRILIDGNTFSTKEEFYTEMERLLTRNLEWKTGCNLDALADLLRGGFGFHEYGERLEAFWNNAEKSRNDLGEDFFDTVTQIMNDEDSCCELKIIDLKTVTYQEEYREDLFDFTERCFRELGKSFEPDGRHSFYRDIEGTFDSFWCMLCNSMVIGTAAIKKIDQNTAELKALYLDREFRGLGLGQKLMDTALSFAREKSYGRVVLDSMAQYTHALKLYEKSGFTRTERYNDNEKADIFMEKILSFRT